MPVKFNQYWTIKSEKREAYEKYIIKEFIPGMNSLGIHIVAGWMVLVGGYSEIFIEGMSSDLELIEKALRDPKFSNLKSNLLNYVRSYKTKILIPTGKKDAYSTDIKEKTIKFNQTWDVISQTRDEYEEYVLNEYYPLLEASNIAVAGEWEVLIGDGPHIICEGRVRDTEKLIGTLQSKKFRTARRKLKGLVDYYESRIFTFHIHKLVGYKSAGYNMLAV
jgi:roadblock/LC7 domain-containing protein